jgi:hypothetical protein
MLTLEQSIKSSEDIQNLSAEEVERIDPSKVKIGTDLQDFALIANTFERGAHATPTEAAVFAPLSRNLENTKTFGKAAETSLGTYLQTPQEDAQKSIEQAERLSADTDTGGEAQGTQANSDVILQSLTVGNTQHSTLGESFGDTLLNFAQECVPCSDRLLTFLELHPNVDLLTVLEGDLKARLSMLTDVAGLLKNFDIYGDFCDLLNLLSFMCVPDLQRIIAMLMSLLIFNIPKLDGLIGLLQALVMPIFAPVLMAITALLDQFVLLIVSPMDCILDAINQQLNKLGYELDADATAQDLSSLKGGLAELNRSVEEAKTTVQEKLNFYIDQIKSFLGEFGAGDTSYIEGALGKLKTIRLIQFITAVIGALAQGHAACSSTGKTPEVSELDNFFNTFLNPHSAFTIRIDPDGNLVVDEKVPEFEDIVQSPTEPEPLPNIGNVLQFEGEDLLNPELATAVADTQSAIQEPARVVMPCKLEVSVEDAEQVNQWITELNQL